MPFPIYLKINSTGGKAINGQVKTLGMEGLIRCIAFETCIMDGETYKELSKEKRKSLDYDRGFTSIKVTTETGPFLPNHYRTLTNGEKLADAMFYWTTATDKTRKEHIYMTQRIFPVKLAKVKMILPDVKNKQLETCPNLAEIWFRYHWLETIFVDGHYVSKVEWPGFDTMGMSEKETREHEKITKGDALTDNMEVTNGKERKAQTGIWAPRWVHKNEELKKSSPEEVAEGDTIQLSCDVDGANEGALVSFEISYKESKGNPIQFASASGTVKDGTATKEWTVDLSSLKKKKLTNYTISFVGSVYSKPSGRVAFTLRDTQIQIKTVEGPAALAHNAKATYSVKSYNRKATDEEKKALSWVVMINGKEVERHEKVGEKFEFTAIGKYAGEKITVHPFFRSPAQNLCVKTTVGQCLVFDGKELIWIDEAHKEIKKWPAWSGDKGHTDPAADGGPIPAGKWVALQDTREHVADDNWWEKLTGGKREEFGEDRIGLLPFTDTAKTTKRKGFFIHGGKEAGSGHGIDLVGKMEEFLGEFVKGGRNLVLVVKGGNQPTAPAGKMRTSKNGKQFIMTHEGFVAKPYNDSADHATIGYGTLLHKGPVTEDDKKKYANGVSKEEARKLLDNAVVEYENALNKAVKVPLNQNQFDALMSWTYNFGAGRLVEKNCTWLKELNQGEYDKVPDGLMMWNKVKKDGKSVELEGLTKRRKEEGELFKKTI